MLLSPVNVSKVLSLAQEETAKRPLKEVLDANLSVADIVSTVADVMMDSQNSGARLRAAELGAKFHGMLGKDDVVNVPTVNIIINSSNGNQLNKILIPRELKELNA